MNAIREQRRREGIDRNTERRRLARAANIERFAEHLAEGAGVIEAAKLIGVSADTGWEYLKSIRAGLGPQAV